MSEKQDTDSIRFSQVLAGALAAVTAAVLGSTMGVAGTVTGAGIASIVTTVGGALYLRSFQRTRERVRTVRDMVIARAGGTSVTLLREEEPAATEAGAADTDEAALARTDSPPARRRLRWPVLVAGSVLAFVLGMMVVTGVEWVRGEPLSGGGGTTVGQVTRLDPGSGNRRDETPQAPGESPAPSTGPATVTVTETPPTSQHSEPAAPPSESDAPGSTPPETATGGMPTGSVTPPQLGEPG